MILIDSCVLIDIVERDPRWGPWSDRHLRDAMLGDRGLVDPVVLAELHGRPRTEGALARVLASYEIQIISLEPSVAERAGLAFRLYRDRRGVHRAILADFLIGAHAATRGIALLTRDRARFAGYFPELVLITPESHPN